MTIVALHHSVMKVHANAIKLKLMQRHAILKLFRWIATAVQSLPSQVGTLASGLETSWWDSGAQRPQASLSNQNAPHALGLRGWHRFGC